MIIDFVAKEVYRIARYLGCSGPEIKNEEVLVLHSGGSDVYSGNNAKGFKGFHQTNKQSRGKIFVDRNPSDLIFATTLAHEKFHLLCGRGSQINWGQSGVFTVYGLSHAIQYKKSRVTYLRKLNEAIVSLLTQYFYQTKLLKSELFKKEARQILFVKIWLREAFRRHKVSPRSHSKFLNEIITFVDLADITRVLGGSVSFYHKLDFIFCIYEESLKIFGANRFAYPSERSELIELMNRVVASGDNFIGNFNQILFYFAKLHFSGSLDCLEQTIDICLGEGSFEKTRLQFKEVRKN